MKSFYLISILLFFSPFLSSCTQEEVGCSSDAECRFDRICQEGTCTGDVDVQPINNVVNNGNNNGTNNGNNNGQNNGNNNQNNGDGCEGGCPGNAICEDGMCVELCESNSDCRLTDACTSRFEAPGNECRSAEVCVLEEYFSEPFEICVGQLNCESGFTQIECVFSEEDSVQCFCEAEFETIEFEESAEVCFDVESLIDLLNQRCGRRIRAL